jgi:hypothetical protein
MEAEIRRFFKGLRDELAEWDTGSRHLAAIVFDPGTGEVETPIRTKPHDAAYPELAEILEKIEQACIVNRIAVSGLRRIDLLDEEFTLTWIGAGQRESVMGFPARASL